MALLARAARSGTAMHRVPQVTGAHVYGRGSLGGKGAGLVEVDRWELPRTVSLPTYILATDFYDRYRERGGAFDRHDERIIVGILEAVGDRPIGVRSSATNEAWMVPQGSWAVRAGENLSFMLPNNHPEPEVRRQQLLSAVRYIYDDFAARHAGDPKERMAIVVNPIPGIFDDTAAGPVFYPYVSGVADSFFPYALRTQDPTEGYARIAFGHGYATVLDDFPVISMATIRDPLPLELLQTGRGQRYFFALDLTKNAELHGHELETMKKLHVRHANFHKIQLLGLHGQVLTIEELIQRDHFGFKTGLGQLMDAIGARCGSHFQIEFVFNVDFATTPYRDGEFHVVQLSRLPEMNRDAIEMPESVSHTYLATTTLQGHGVKRGVRYAVVVSPFLYSRDRHDAVRNRLAEVNRSMRQNAERYVAIVPGRLGSTNKDWGIAAVYDDVSQAVGIFEYGVDIAGRVQPPPDEGEMTGGIYGSHFLYMALGGYSEDQRRRQARMYGSQGTHFFTNIMGSGVVYGYVSPIEDMLDPWFFSPPEGAEALYVLTFPSPVSIYADSVNQRCMVVAEGS
jgi:hypothetical protein